MRKRSNTLYATSVEEYTELAVKASQFVNPFADCESADSTMDYSTGFAQRSQSENYVLLKEDSLTEIEPVTRKIMIIGSSGTGKHSLINSCFEDRKSKPLASLKQTMDLIIQDDVEDEVHTKYYFWIRTLRDQRYDEVIKVYYKNMSIFVFVFSITDKTSFEILKENIAKITKEIPQERFTGILIGNKSDAEHEREVLYSEGAALKDEFNLVMFIETNHFQSSLRETMLNIFS